MEKDRARTSKGGMKASLMLAGCVTVLALPSAVLAFSTSLRAVQPHADSAVDSLDPDTTNENLLRVIAMRSLSKGQPFPFTPAGTPNRPDRALTVAVRVDSEAAKSIIVVHNRIQVARDDTNVGTLRIAPAAFNLGVARGYQNFSPDTAAAQPAPTAHTLTDAPELRKFSLTAGTAEPAESRFAPRISIDEKRPSGRAPHTFAGESGEVDVGGAYRLTKNLDVTAGVRYSQDRERLMPLTDGKLDSQAIYLGTQFRF
ncbi:hypothetical protein [Novosphingobium sp. PhB165]|uniref:hypothetical protein n=1 Tax=Novosphingobium sp. PhB165 TaxID=2485105 RepID=UPI00104A71B3|nr:hypothetical protein [Novosphingobium sp. PhB165]